jgi:hypothetical protein
MRQAKSRRGEQSVWRSWGWNGWVEVIFLAVFDHHTQSRQQLFDAPSFAFARVADAVAVLPCGAAGAVLDFSAGVCKSGVV